MTTEAIAGDEPLDLPALIEQGRLTVAAVDQLRASIDRQARAQTRRTIATVVLVGVLAVVAVDNRLQIDRLQRQFCPLVTASITRPGETPPSTAHGRDVERTARDLAARIGCDILPR